MQILLIARVGQNLFDVRFIQSFDDNILRAKYPTVRFWRNYCYLHAICYHSHNALFKEYHKTVGQWFTRVFGTRKCLRK